MRATCSPDVGCAITVARKSLLGQVHKKSWLGYWTVRLPQITEQRKRLKGASEAQDARRQSFMLLCAANTSGGISSLPETRSSRVYVQETCDAAIARGDKFGPWSSIQWLPGRH